MFALARNRVLPLPWGEPVPRTRDMGELARSCRAVPHGAHGAHGEREEVSDRTWNDLSLDDVFARLDRCATGIGQQALYARLRRPALDPERVASFDRLVRAFTDDPALRESFGRATAPLGPNAPADLPALLYDGASLRVPKLFHVAPFATASTVLAALASFVWPVALLALVALAIGNIVLRLQIQATLSLHAATLSAFGPLVDAARNVGSIGGSTLRTELDALGHAAAGLRAHRSAFSWLSLDARRMNDVAASLVSYANVLFLVDASAFVRAAAALRAGAPLLRAVYEQLGELDAARSIASVRAGEKKWTTPIFTSRGAPILADGLVHPLVAAPVANDAHLAKGRGWLVLGANMAGKSTWLRAVATSAILAQAVATVPAAFYAAPLLVVRTLIHAEDELTRGRSRFLAEAEAGRDLLLEPTGPGERLCIVDELFRGTNTRDRVAAGAALLRALVRSGARVVAATHDAELAALLQDDFAAYHFDERVGPDGVRYSFRLEEGAAAPRNALAVLELVGFPADVVDHARALTASAEARGKWG
jgi:hypothetical protein